MAVVFDKIGGDVILWYAYVTGFAKTNHLKCNLFSTALPRSRCRDLHNKHATM